MVTCPSYCSGLRRGQNKGRPGDVKFGLLDPAIAGVLINKSVRAVKRVDCGP